jgi:starvation-inducible outer membrane lipoprotein
MKPAIVIIALLLSGCVSIPDDDENRYPACSAVTLRSGETCKIDVFASPQWPRL